MSRKHRLRRDRNDDLSTGPRRPAQNLVPGSTVLLEIRYSQELEKRGRENTENRKSKRGDGGVNDALL